MGGWAKVGGVWGGLAAIAVAVEMATAQAPSLTLITPPPGHTQTFATGLSADGTKLVGYSSLAGDYRAFSWTASGGLVDLGSMPGFSPYSRALGVSGDGNVVVGRRDTITPTPTVEAFRSIHGSYQSLGAPPAGFENSVAYSANHDGSVIVGAVDEANSGPSHAMRWTPSTGMQHIGLARPNDIAGYFTGVSRDGSTAIGISGGGGPGTYDAYAWTEARGWQWLQPLPGTAPGYYASPSGANSNGSLVTGYVDPVGDRSVAMLWRNGQASYLGTLGVDWDMFAGGLSEDGAVIVGAGRDSLTRREVGWISLNGGSPVVFQDYIASLGVQVPDGWALVGCGSVSQDGRLVTGLAQSLTTSQYEGFIATIPSPATSVVVTLFGLLVGRRRSRASL